MSPRSRLNLLVVSGVGLSLVLAATGCQLQIAFMESGSSKPAPQEVQTASKPSESQASGVRLASNQIPAPHANGHNGYPAHNGHNGYNGHAPMPNGAPMMAHPMANGHVAPGQLSANGDHGGGPIPTEKAKTSLPPYVIEPPDILLIDPIRLVPRGPYTISPLDVLLIRVAEPLPNQPIDGTYTVTPDGTINLGYNYGLVRVAGLTLEDTERAIRGQLARVLKDPQVAVGLAQFRGVQQTRGEHLVRPDGTINLGSYGCVYIAGLTLQQAKVAIERHLSQYLQDPEISVDVFAYNSKVYYVITDGAGFGMQVFRFPVTGNETVLDAITNIQGLPAVASSKKIWVARPAPAQHHCAQILPVDWAAIVQGGVTSTNYQLFPGDRVYVQSDSWIRFDNMMAKVLAPFERLLGITFLTSSTIQNFRNNNNSGGGNIGFVAPLR